MKSSTVAMILSIGTTILLWSVILSHTIKIKQLENDVNILKSK